jgi:hypothetical protein
MTAENKTTTQDTILYCANHPDRETTLRCNRCEKPICAKCAVLTPTGYRCMECVRGQQKIFSTATWFDYPVAFVLTAVLSYLGSLLIPNIGFFTILVAPIAGVVIAESVRFVIRRRRSKRLFQLTTFAAAFGSLIPVVFMLLGFLVFFSRSGSGGLGVLFPLIWQVAYAFIVTSTVYYRMGGINI